MTGAPGFRWLDEREQRAWRSYLAASTLVQQRIERDLQQQHGMPHAYYMILAMLSEAPGRRLRLAELAELLDSSISRLSHAIRKLDEAGWIEKTPDADDRRVSWAHLTELGWEVLTAAAPTHVTSVVDTLFDALTDEQVEQFHAISSAILARVAPGDDPNAVLRPGRP